jgi:hypothetical protein
VIVKSVQMMSFELSLNLGDEGDQAAAA